MELNPYSEELRRADADVADAEMTVRSAQRELGWFDSFDEEQVRIQATQLAGERLTDLERQLTLAKQAASNALLDLQQHDTSRPDGPVKAKWWKYALVGAGATAVVVSGVGAVYGLVVLGEAAIVAASAAVLGTGVGAVGGTLVTKDVNAARSQEAARTAAAWTTRRSVLQEALNVAQERASGAERAITVARDAAARAQENIDAEALRHRTTNRAQLMTELNRCTEVCASPLSIRERVRDQFDVVHVRIAAHVERIEKYDGDLLECDVQISLAKGLAEKLAELPEDSRRERREVHEACRCNFGKSYPGDVVGELSGKREYLLRKRAKIEKEALDVVRVHQFGITRVVIDGNNMCHLPGERGDFIGLPAIKAACAALKAQGRAVRVLFDPSIRGRERLGPKASDEWLAAEIGSDVSVIVMPKGTRADEAVLREAAPKHSAAVSRDLMDEADLSRMKYPVLLEGRVFEHHITNQDRRVAIPALDIDVPWAAE